MKMSNYQYDVRRRGNCKHDFDALYGPASKRRQGGVGILDAGPPPNSRGVCQASPVQPHTTTTYSVLRTRPGTTNDILFVDHCEARRFAQSCSSRAPFDLAAASCTRRTRDAGVSPNNKRQQTPDSKRAAQSRCCIPMQSQTQQRGYEDGTTMRPPNKRCGRGRQLYACPCGCEKGRTTALKP
jgi:hypothetical protein